MQKQVNSRWIDWSLRYLSTVGLGPSKYKMLVQNWQELLFVHTLCGDRLRVINKFKYLGSLITPGGGVLEEITSRIDKAKASFANMRHMWLHLDIRVPLDWRVYNASWIIRCIHSSSSWGKRSALLSVTWTRISYARPSSIFSRSFCMFWAGLKISPWWSDYDLA